MISNDAGTTSTWTYNSANQVSSGYAYDGAGNQTSDPSVGTLAYNDAGQMISTGSGAENFSYAGRTQAELLSDGSAAAITYGLAGQDGQPWVQDYTATGFLHLGNRWYSPPVEANAGVGNQVGPARFTQQQYHLLCHRNCGRRHRRRWHCLRILLH